MVEVNKYTIQDFNNILNSMIIEKIDDDIKNKIDNLSQSFIILIQLFLYIFLLIHLNI